MTVWKPLIVCPSPDTAQRLRAALLDAGLPEPLTIDAYPPPGTIPSLAMRSGCTLCLIDLASDQEQALGAIGDASPVLPVVALNPRNDADVILRSLRRGAREFLGPVARTGSQPPRALGPGRRAASAAERPADLRRARQARLRRQHARHPPGGRM